MIEELLSAAAVHVIAKLAFASRGIRDGLDVVLTIFARHTHRLRLVGLKKNNNKDVKDDEQ